MSSEGGDLDSGDSGVFVEAPVSIDEPTTESKASEVEETTPLYEASEPPMPPTMDEEESTPVAPSTPGRMHAGKTVVDAPVRSETFVSDLEKILLWEQPVSTGVWLAAGLLGFYLWLGAGYSLMTMVCYIGLSQIFAVYAAKLVAPLFDKFGYSDITKSVNDGLETSRQGELKIIQGVASLLETFTNKWYGVLTGGCWKTNLKFAGSLAGLSVLGCMLSLPTMLFLSFLLAFSVPVLYKQNKTLVDAKLGDAQNQLSEISGVAEKRFRASSAQAVNYGQGLADKFKAKITEFKDKMSPSKKKKDE